MTLFGFNSRRYEMCVRTCLSVLLVYATQHTANCVALAILIAMYHIG